MKKDIIFDFFIVVAGMLVGFSVARIASDFLQGHGVMIATGQGATDPLPPKVS